MSTNKAALKAAKAALDAEDYETVVTQSQIVLASDSSNYPARLFLGRAFEKQGKFDSAAETYRKAADSKPDEAQAWLGLCSVYEAQGSNKVDEYIEAAVHVGSIHAKADDAHRCQTVIDKLGVFVKQHLDHLLELGDLLAAVARSGVRRVRGEEPDRVVSPVVARPT